MSKPIHLHCQRRVRLPFGCVALITALLVLFIIGCEDAEAPAVPKPDPGPVPPAEQRAGDPEIGYDVLVNGGYVTCGIPYSAWARAARPPETTPTLPDRSGRNANMPYYLTAHRNDEGVEIVSSNCLLCHAKVLNNELIIGLGNESLDFTDDPSETVDAVGAYVSGDAATAAWRKWGARITTIAPYMITDTVGVNPAPNLTLALIAHRNPRTLEWSEVPLMEPPPERPLPVSVPPWWRMAKKHALFYNAMGRGDHARFMMMKSLVCSDSVEEARAIDAQFPDVRAYIASLAPPAYPFSINTALAEQGKTIFERHCAGCHGTYGLAGSYPNLVVGLAAVGTDPAYAQQAYAESDRFMDWFNRSWYGDIAQARPALGYIAPPLEGIWATAPYLHNGSVPTLASLLDSDTRPEYWRMSFDQPRYDQNALGWRYQTLTHGKEGASDPLQRKRIYDTSLHGYSNAGHTFGNGLTDAERRSLVEYLKTL